MNEIDDLFQLPDNILDLEEYRRRRIVEGTWPEPPEKMREWWLEYARRRKSFLKNK